MSPLITCNCEILQSTEVIIVGMDVAMRFKSGDLLTAVIVVDFPVKENKRFQKKPEGQEMCPLLEMKTLR